MSGPFDAYHDAYGLGPLPSGRAEPPPPNPDFGDVFHAARTLQSVDNSDYLDRLTEKSYRPVVDAVNDWRRAHSQLARFNTPDVRVSATLDLRGMNNAYGTANAARITPDEAADEIFAEIAKIRSGNPDFLKGVPGTREEFWSNAVASEQQDRAAARGVLSKSRGFLRGATSFAGSVTKSFEDPFIVATLPIGGMGRTVATRILSEGVVNASVTLVSQPQAAINRKALGETLTAAEARDNVIGAFVGGAGFQTGIEGLAAGYRLLFKGHLMPDEIAAGHVIDRENEIDASSPFVPDDHAPAQHRLKLGEWIDRVMPGQSQPNVSRNVSRETSSVSGHLSLDRGIVSFFTGKGYSEAQARGIAAGIEAESRSNHGVVNPDSGALGLGQWLGPRKAELIRRYGPNPTRQQQLEFLHWELQGGDAGGKAVLAAQGETGVLDAYIRKFMRPAAGAEVDGDLERGLASLGRERDALSGLSATDEAGGLIERPAAMDAERLPGAEVARVEAPALPELRRDLFGSDEEFRAARDFVEREASGLPTEVAEFRYRNAIEMRESFPDLADVMDAKGNPTGVRWQKNPDGSRIWIAPEGTAYLRGAGGEVRNGFDFGAERESVIAQIEDARLHRARDDALLGLDARTSEHIVPPQGVGRFWDKARAEGRDPFPMYVLRSLGGEQPVGYPKGWAASLPAVERMLDNEKGGKWEIVRLDPQPGGTAISTRVSRETSRGTSPVPDAPGVSEQSALRTMAMQDPLVARFDDPAGPEAKLQAEALTHDVKASIETGEVKGLSFATRPDAEAQSAEIVLAGLDAEDAALAAIRGCL